MTEQLHVFASESDWIVARDLDDAWAIALEMWGGEMSDYGERDDFTQLQDDSALSINISDADPPEEAERVTKTCAEWIASNGRGWLCGRDF